jgi:hypothetical protein
VPGDGEILIISSPRTPFQISRPKFIIQKKVFLGFQSSSASSKTNFQLLMGYTFEAAIGISKNRLAEEAI